MLVNTGANLIEQPLQPGLSVRVTKKTKKVGKKKVVTHFAQALDDGFGVPARPSGSAAGPSTRNAAGQGKGAGRLREGRGARIRRRFL